MKRIRSLALPADTPLLEAAYRTVRWGVAVVLFAVLLAVCVSAASAAPPAEPKLAPPTDSQIFLDGFRAYQQKDYGNSQVKLGEVVARYPTSPVRDMALYWLSRACYRSGNHRDAARYLSQLFREYPHTPLKELVGLEMKQLLTRYERGESLPTATGTAANADARNEV